MGEQADIPRWAAQLGEGTWSRINELIDAGWRTPDIAREVRLPESKLRSLQMYVRKAGPRRRLVQFAEFKNRVLERIGEFGPQLVDSLSVIAAMAVSSETKPAVQVRALEAMTNFVNTLSRMMGEDAKEEESRRRDEKGGPVLDVSEVVRNVLAAYGK